MQLADILGVSSKTVSKWETCKGLPDITLIEPLAKVLSVSVMELMSGDTVVNKNISSNVLRAKFYVCPVCSNIIRTMGDAVISCCGITLPPLEAEESDENHQITIEKVEDEHFVTVKHDMTKEHYISFIAYVTTDRVQFVKLYPEGNAQTRLNFRGKGDLYIYCNKHGLMKTKILFSSLAYGILISEKKSGRNMYEYSQNDCVCRMYGDNDRSCRLQ